MNHNSSPLFSVIIPNYNHAKYLPRAIESVINQTLSNWEILIIDNHSSDETEKVVNPYLSEKIHLFKIHNNGIIAASRNLGITHSKGEWIAFLDSDDWWSETKLEENLLMIKQFEADLIYHDLYIVKDKKNITHNERTRGEDISNKPWEYLLNYGNSIPNSSVVVRKSCIESIGGISEERTCISWEDYDTWLRLAQNGFLFRKINKVLGYYWKGGGNVSNPLQHIENSKNFLLKYGEYIDNPYWIYTLKIRSYYEQGSYLNFFIAIVIFFRELPLHFILKKLRLILKYQLLKM